MNNKSKIYKHEIVIKKFMNKTININSINKIAKLKHLLSKNEIDLTCHRSKDRRWVAMHLGVWRTHFRTSKNFPHALPRAP